MCGGATMQFALDLHPSRYSSVIGLFRKCARSFLSWRRHNFLSLSLHRTVFIAYFRDIEDVGSLYRRLQDAGVGPVAVVNAPLVLHQMQVRCERTTTDDDVCCAE